MFSSFHWYTDNQRSWVAVLPSFLEATDNNTRPKTDSGRNELTCSKDAMKASDLSEQGGRWWKVSLKCFKGQNRVDNNHGQELGYDLDCSGKLLWSLWQECNRVRFTLIKRLIWLKCGEWMLQGKTEYRKNRSYFTWPNREYGDMGVISGNWGGTIYSHLGCILLILAVTMWSFLS